MVPVTRGLVFSRRLAGYTCAHAGTRIRRAAQWARTSVLSASATPGFSPAGAHVNSVFRNLLMGLLLAGIGVSLFALWFLVEGYRRAPTVLQAVYQQRMPLKLSDFTSFQLRALVSILRQSRRL